MSGKTIPVQRVIERLRQGYGVEDILVLDGIPTATSRHIIAMLRDGGAIKQVLHGDR